MPMALPRTVVQDYMVASHEQQRIVSELLDLCSERFPIPADVEETLRRLEISQLRVDGLCSMLGLSSVKASAIQTKAQSPALRAV
jgi:hypothetical protein